MIIKERLDEILNQIRTNVSIDVKNGVNVDFNDSKDTMFSQYHSPALLIAV